MLLYLTVLMSTCPIEDAVLTDDFFGEKYKDMALKLES